MKELKVDIDMNEQPITQRELLDLLRRELPNAIARAIAETPAQSEEWVSLQKAATRLDCSVDLLREMVTKGKLIPNIHYFDLTPDESRRNYRFNVTAIAKKRLNLNPSRKRKYA